MAHDAGESISLFEPLFLMEGSTERSKLNDMVLSLAEKSAALASATSPSVKSAFSRIIDVADCYFGVTLDGYAIHPVDAEKVVSGKISGKTRADTHLSSTWATRKWIAEKEMPPSFSAAFALAVHTNFYRSMPAGSRGIKSAGTYRTKLEDPQGDQISQGAVPRFVARIGQAYENGTRLDRLLSAAWAQHRLMWVRPFDFGSDTVARLTSYAILRSEVNEAGLWSMYRGFYRWGTEYRELLRLCGIPAPSATGGAGLDAGALANFAGFFLWTCTEEVERMARVLDPVTMRGHMLDWAREKTEQQRIPAGADRVMRALIEGGDMDLTRIGSFTGLGADRVLPITAALAEEGAIVSDGGNGTRRLNFTVGLSQSFFPGLLPVY